MAALKVLIVEDNSEWQQLIKDVLQTLDCDVEIVSSYAEARTKLRQRQVDVITLDMELNDADKAHSGWLLIRAIARGQYANARDARVIILSGSVDFQHSPDKVAELYSEFKVMERFLWKGSHDWDDKLYDTVEKIRQARLEPPTSVAARISSSQLAHALSRYFNESELRALCLDLQVDYESLPGSNKTDKARELVLYLDRRSNLPTLVEAFQRLRPNVSL